MEPPPTDQTPHSKLHDGCFAKPTEERLGFKLTYILTPGGITSTSQPVSTFSTHTHTPYFSTNDRSLTSFLRFPYEIRVEIYRDLLYCYWPVQYMLCMYTNRLTHSRSRSAQFSPYIRHGMFPAILQCCRAINEEGSDVLYGENLFDTACNGSGSKYGLAVVNSWPLAERNLERIRRLDMGFWLNPTVNHCGLTASKLSQTFPRLAFAYISVENMAVPKWEEFIELSADFLSGIRKVMIVMWLPVEVSEAIRNRVRKAGEDEDKQPGQLSASEKAACIGTHEPVVGKNFPTRKLRWKFKEHLSEDTEYSARWQITLSWG